MASLELDPESGRYRVRFRFAGQEYKRSLRTKQRRIANASLGSIEETLRLVQLGVCEVPSGVEPGAFILSGGRARTPQATRSNIQTLSDLFAAYERELPSGAKEVKTLEGERIHRRHLQRHLGRKARLDSMTRADVQKYVDARLKDTFNGRHVGPFTIKKELSTLRLVWHWAVRQGHIESPPPVDQIVYPKQDEKPPFMTFAEIERTLNRNGVSQEEEQLLWESLYLTRQEVDELLAWIKNAAKRPFVYPMFLLAAHTGMRRSEVVRCEVTDLDFDSRTVLIREKKRSRKYSTSFRRVPMTSLIERVFRTYLQETGNCRYLLSLDGERPLAERYATKQFRDTLDGGQWNKVRGFHVFRHSFASNAAIEGIDQRMIDEWMGHQTEEMRQRYRHLAPSQQQDAINSIYGVEDSKQ